MTALRIYLFLFFVSLVNVVANAQNKTFGVGTASPNPNAALHVESPTLNQGMIMPRLTTAQRIAMTLAGADKGITVYDTDLNTMITWDGVAWVSSSKLIYPYSDNFVNATGTPDLFKLSYNNAENKRIVRIENNNATNGSSTLSVSNLGTGLAGFFSVNNPTSGGTALQGTTNSDLGGVLAPVGVYGESSGTGSLGGAFWNTNAANTWPALYAESVGSGPSIRSEKNSGGGNVLTAANNAATGDGIFIDMSNGTNTGAGLRVNHAGAGNAIETTGNILAGQFIGDGSGLTNLPPMNFPFAAVNTDAPDASNLFDLATNASNPANIVSVANFSNLNAAALSNVLKVNNAGSGAAMVLTGTGAGSGGRFIINNVANTLWALTASTNGGGDAFQSLTTGTARAGTLRINNVSNTSTAMHSETNGTGSAGSFVTTNASSTAYALIGETNGANLSAGVYGHNTGDGFGVYAKSENGSSFGSAAVYGEQLGTGDTAGAFRINNTANNFAGLYGETNGSAAGSAAVRGLNLGGGNGAYFRKNGSNTNTAAVWADNFGTNGYGAIIQNVDATNPTAALFAEAVGGGPSIWANKDTGESGNALQAIHIGTSGDAIFASTSASSGSAISAQSSTEARAGYFTNSNAGSGGAVVTVDNAGGGTSLEAFNNGTGYAIYAESVSSADALYANKPIGSSGSAGNFNNSEPLNGASTLFAMTNASTGSALGLMNNADGNALAIFAGGVKISTFQATGGGSITTRAAAYTLDANAYTFPGGFLSEGDTFYIFNMGGGSASIDGQTITAGTGRVFIVIGGVLRGF